MSRVALKLPKVGLVMENARLVRWLKTVGQDVKQGEPLLEIETEKSIVEIESTESGRLVEILLPADHEARVGDQIAWLERDVSDASGAASAATSFPAATGAAPAWSSTGTNPAPVKSDRPGSGTPDGSPDAPLAAVVGNRGRLKSSPVARRLAAQHAVDLNSVVGTGPRERVQLVDVRRIIEERSGQNAPAPLQVHCQQLSPMRRALARSMTLSNATVPQFAVERALDWTAIQAVRTKLLTELPEGAPRPSVNDFLLQAIARALLYYPALNATFSGDANSPNAALVAASGAHIGLVIALEDGLLVPVVHHVERLSITELAQRRNELVERAVNGRLKREELEGASFSLSNLGSSGPDRFNALINPPQSAILAVGRGRDVVVVSDGHFAARPISQLTLTVDHRVADGRLAADFLAALVDIAEGDAWRLR